MAKWMLKAVVQKAISYLPKKEQVNFFFQKYVTKGVYLDDQHFAYKLEAARDHLRFYDRFGTEPRQRANVLELGTGWYPIVPTVLFLAGFEQTTSIDLRRWMNPTRQRIAFTRILDYYDRGLLQAYAPDIDQERLAILREICAAPLPDDVATGNAAINLSYRVMDATSLDFPDAAFDFICSNNTFEHVFAGVLKDILKEFKRVVKPTGVMSHFVDLSDHFAHMDGSINIYNFLRFSAKQWRMIDNDIQPQNRLRWKDYRAMYTDLGIPIRHEEIRKGDTSLVAEIPLAEEFRAYTAEELAVSHGYFIS
jgi:SAM-dependent methyltransferase